MGIQGGLNGDQMAEEYGNLIGNIDLIMLWPKHLTKNT